MNSFKWFLKTVGLEIVTLVKVYHESNFKLHHFQKKKKNMEVKVNGSNATLNLI